MDEKAYQEFLNSTPFHGWEKESVVKIIHNISKVWDNIPKEQFKGIMGTIVKQFNENPDKTIEALKSGSIMKMFATPQLKNALAAAGVTYFFSGSRVFKSTSNARAMLIIVSRVGFAIPRSILLSVSVDKPVFKESCTCVNPFLALSAFILLANSLKYLSKLIFVL